MSDKATVLELTRDVTNPKPDRRKKRDGWALPVWKKGSRWTQDILDFGSDTLYQCVKPEGQGYAGYKTWGDVKDLGFENGDFKVVVATTWKDLSREEGGWANLAGDVLEKLIRTEAASIDEVREALRWVLAHDEEDD